MENNTTNASANIRIDGDSLDVDLLREIPAADFDEPSFTEEQSGDSDIEESGTEEDLSEDEGKVKASPKKDELEDEEGEVEEQGEEESEGEDLEEEESEEGEYLEVKAKNGKKIKISKEALFEVKIDGKVEELTAQEVVNRASGAIALDRKHSELGRERSKFLREKSEFEQKVNVTKDNLEMLQNIAENGTPEDLAQYFGMLTGKDPSSVLEGIVSRAMSFVDQLSQMTDRERMMYNENRRFRFEQQLQKKQALREQQEQTQQRERAQVTKLLQDEGLTNEDFIAAAEDVRERIANGELTGKYSALDIAEYAVGLNHEKKVVTAISDVNKSLLSNDEFVSKVSKAISGAERAAGEKFTAAEAKAFVKRILETQNKGKSESLSKKVQLAKKSGKTNSKIASSRNQEKSDGALTLQDHWDRLYGGD